MSADTSKATGFFHERRGWLIAGVVVIVVIVLIVREFRAYRRRLWLRSYGYPPHP